MRPLRILSAVLPLILAGPAALAQTNFSETFFLTDSPTAYRFNPALNSGKDFIGTGGISLNSRGNVGATTFLFDSGGRTVTALSKEIPAERFFSKLNKDNYILIDLNTNLFSYGFTRDEAYHTVEVNARGNTGGTIPFDVFDIIKSGINKPDFDFSNTRSFENIYLELAYGYSRQLTDIVSLGARAKLLIGLSSIDASFSKFSIGIDDQNVPRADFHAELFVAGRARTTKGYDGGTFLNPGPAARRAPLSFPAGLGMAVDLGIAITPNEYWTLSLSANNLGFLCWFYGLGGGVTAYIDPRPLETFASDDLTLAQLAAMGIVVVQQIQDSATITEGKMRVRAHTIPFCFNLGAKYKMPFYDRMSVGLTGHLTTYRTSPYWETRFGVTVRPLDWLDLSANLGYGSFGMLYGMMASVGISRFHLNLATQRTVSGNIPLTFLPRDPYYRTLTLGLTFDL